MLQTMRDLAHSWLFKGLMLLLVLSFGIWGIGDMFRTNLAAKAVAKVGSEEITVQTLEKIFMHHLTELRKTRGVETTSAQARASGMLDKTLNELIEESLFNQEAKRLGLNLSDRDIFARFRDLPQFKDKDGTFDLKTWERMIRSSGMSETMLIDMERQTTLRRLVFEALTKGVKTPDIIVDHMYAARGQKRMLEVLSLKNSSMGQIPAPTDEDLQDVYKNNAKRFTAPDYRAITVAILSPQQTAQDIKISDDELRKAYEDHKDAYQHNEQRDIVQIILQNEDKAKDIAAALKETKDFAKDAKKRGYTAVPVNKLDEKSVFQQLYTTVFSLDSGDVSDPIKTDMGWHIVQVKAIYPAGVQSFDSVKDELRETLARNKSDDIVTQTVNRLDEELAANRSLEEIADAMKLRLVKIPPVTSKGVLENGKDPSEFPMKDDVLKTAFAQESGESSSVMEDKKGGYFVVRTDDVKPSHVRAFDEVKAEVKSVWLEERRVMKAFEEIQKIADQVKNGKSLDSFANRDGVDVTMAKPVNGLGEMDPDLPKNAYGRILLMQKGDIIVEPSQDRQFIMRLVSLRDVDLDKPDSSRIRLVDYVNNIRPYEIVDQYAAQMRKAFPVKKNEKLLATLRSRPD